VLHAPDQNRHRERRAIALRATLGGLASSDAVEIDAAAIRRSYDRVAERYATEVGGELDRRPLERALLAALPELAGLDDDSGVIADLGAGPGHVARHLRGLGHPVVALDLSPAMATIALERYGVPAVAGSLTTLPFADASLGAAVVLFAWIHLDDAGLAAAAAELTRVLRPGGVAVVSFHIGDHFVHLDEWFGQAVDVDFRFLRPTDVTDVLARAGLAVVATLEREPVPDVEAQTRRCYLFARR
jgi:SAM-dependent methyltransferase